MTQAAMDAIPAFLDRRAGKPLIYTFTMLQAYRNCGHAMYRRYIKKDQPYVETPQMKWGNDVHSAFEQRVGAGKPLPETMQQWEGFAAALDGRGAVVEQKLAVTKEGRATGFWDNDCWFRGKVDVVMLKELLEGGDRALVIGHTDEERVVHLADVLRTLKRSSSVLRASRVKP